MYDILSRAQGLTWKTGGKCTAHGNAVSSKPVDTPVKFGIIEQKLKLVLHDYCMFLFVSLNGLSPLLSVILIHKFWPWKLESKDFLCQNVLIDSSIFYKYYAGNLRIQFFTEALGAVNRNTTF